MQVSRLSPNRSPRPGQALDRPLWAYRLGSPYSLLAAAGRWGFVIVLSLLLAVDVMLITASRGPLRAALLAVVTLALLAALWMATIGHLRRLILAGVMFDIPFQIDFNIGFDQRIARFGAISGFNVSLTLIGMTALYVLWTWSILTRRTGSPSRSFFRLGRPIFFYLAAVIGSMLAAGSPQLSIYELNLLLQMTLLFFYIAHNTRTWNDLHFIIIMLFVGLVLFSIFTIFLSLTGGFTQGAASSSGAAISRFGGGSLGQPNVAASYIMMVLLVIFSSMIQPQPGKWFRRLAALTVALGGLALLTTGSRGGWGGFAIGIALFCWLTWRAGWLSPRLPLTYLLVALTAIAPFYQAILNRLGSAQAQSSASARDPLNLLALRMIRDHPILGVGANNFAFNLPKYVTSEFANAWIDTVHNKYLLVWAETGVIGLAAFLWFLLSILFLGRRLWRQKSRDMAPLALACTLAVVAAMTHMLVAQYHSRVQFQLLGLLCGTIVAMSRMAPDTSRGSV